MQLHAGQWQELLPAAAAGEAGAGAAMDVELTVALPVGGGGGGGAVEFSLQVLAANSTEGNATTITIRIADAADAGACGKRLL
eukprot:COSAG06_NODE_3106_length_5852_cov_6.243177_5_plen_83_part_00